MAAERLPSSSRRMARGTWAQLALLTVLACGLLLRWSEGNLTVYVNPAFVWLSLLSIGLLALAALPKLLALCRGEAVDRGQGLGWPSYLLASLAAGLVLL